MCRLQNTAMRDYQESVTTGQTDAGQSDPCVPLYFASDSKSEILLGFVNIFVHFYTRHK